MSAFSITFLMSLNAETEIFKRTKIKTGSQIVESPSDDYHEHNNKLDIGEFLTCFRIEYELLPKKSKCNVDVTCWRNVVKVSSSDTFRYYRILKSGQNLWFPVPMHHLLKELSEDELLNLRSHNIICNIVSTKKEISSKLSTLYCSKNQADQGKFVEYFEADPNKPDHHRDKLNESAELLQMATKGRTSDSIISWVKLRGPTECFLVYDTISKTERGEEIKHRNFTLSSEKPREKREDLKVKMKKREEKKSNPYFIIPAEVFLTETSVVVYKLKESNDVFNLGYVFLSSENVFAKKLKTSLNPFIVKIHKLDCIPVELLRQNGYSEIFISYDIPYLAKYESPPKPIERTIYFNESHVYFTKDIPSYKYLEFLRTEKVKVHINGIRDEEKQDTPALFGELREDMNYSKRMQPRESFHYFRKKESFRKVEILAISTYDLSSLLKNIWKVRLAASCHHPENVFHKDEEDDMLNLVDTLTMPEINLTSIDRRKNASPLQESILAAELTTMDMEFMFLCPQHTDYHLKGIIRTYKRFFITFFDLSRAKQIVSSILQHNQDLIGLNAVVMDPVNFSDDKMKIELKKRKLSKQQQASDESLKRRLTTMVHTIDDVITGFMIDNLREIHIFVEGISHGYILEIWNKIHKIDTSVAKVFLNSELEFEKRLYEKFMNVGIYPMTLKIPLNTILENQDIYIQGLVPTSCSKALKKLQMLLQTETLEEMLRQELFPTYNEIISFSVEFGVPMRWCK